MQKQNMVRSKRIWTINFVVCVLYRDSKSNFIIEYIFGVYIFFINTDCTEASN